MNPDTLFAVVAVGCGVWSFVLQRHGRSLCQPYYDPQVKLWLHADGIGPDQVAKARATLAASRSWLVASGVASAISFYFGWWA